MTVVRRLAADPRVVALLCALGLATLLLYGADSGYRASKIAQFLIFTLVYLSLVVLTGMSGVISLLSATFLGIGAFTVATALTRFDVPFLLSVGLAGLVTSLACIVVGLPVLRLRASAFLVMTLGFIALVEEVVFTNDWCCGGGTSGVPAPRPELLDSDQRYMVFCAAVLVAVYLFTLSWRRAPLRPGGCRATR